MNEDKNINLSIHHSDDIKEFVSALAKAQGQMKPAVFNRTNPHYKNKYADFTSCMDACREPLSSNGLALMQFPATVEGKLNLITMIAHTSGQWIKGEFPLIPSKMDSQGIGSSMTYAKRYSLCGMLGIVSDAEIDDDGEAAVGRPAQPAMTMEPVKPAAKISSDQLAHLRDLFNKLDQVCKDKISEKLKTNYGADIFSEINASDFVAVRTMFENALKYLESKKSEVTNG
jgi:hypothetical protein